MKTTYKVLWGRYQGHGKGEEFDAELDTDTEQRAVKRGQLRVVKRPDKPKGKDKADG